MAQLTFVGTSDAFNAAGRLHSCYLLEGDGFGPLMIDFGATALAGLRRLGKDPSAIRGYAFTHLHGDHIGGWPFLVIDGMFHAVRRDTLAVLGPVGSEARLDALLRVAYGGLADKERPYASTVEELLPGATADFAGVRIEGFPARHMKPPEQPLCLRIELPDGTTVAFSGDTAMCDGLLAAAAGVDVLVAECSGLAPPCGDHCSWEEWCEVLPSLTAKRIFFTHLGTDVRAAVARLLAEVPAGSDVAFADDGLVVTLERYQA